MSMLFRLRLCITANSIIFFKQSFIVLTSHFQHFQSFVSPAISQIFLAYYLRPSILWPILFKQAHLLFPIVHYHLL